MLWGLETRSIPREIENIWWLKTNKIDYEQNLQNSKIRERSYLQSHHWEGGGQEDYGFETSLGHIVRCSKSLYPLSKSTRVFKKLYTYALTV